MSDFTACEVVRISGLIERLRDGDLRIIGDEIADRLLWLLLMHPDETYMTMLVLLGHCECEQCVARDAEADADEGVPS